MIDVSEHTHLTVRDVTLADAPTICDILNYYVEHTAITFETKPISVAEMQNRIQQILFADYPYYVGMINGKIVGFCYLHAWNYRQAYDKTAEVTIYLDHNYTGHGLGYQLYEHLFEYLDKIKFHTLIAGITLPNEHSVCLHESFGFRQVSFLPEIGYKLNQWQNVGHWLLTLK